MFYSKKSLGQNFLINEGIVEKIIKAGEVNQDDTIIEIGPGTGKLTEKLVKKAGKVIAIEKDRRLIEDLKIKFPEAEIIEEDVLKLNPSMLPLKSDGYKIIANIPYYITSHFIRQVFEKWPRPSVIILMVQREVAQRIMAMPPDMNLLALSVQFYAKAEKVADVSRGSFRPIPKVDSVIIKIRPKEQTLSPEKTTELFKIMKMGFSEKRKQLSGTLSRKLGLDKDKILSVLNKAGLEDKIRPENLSLDDWIKILHLI